MAVLVSAWVWAGHLVLVPELALGLIPGPLAGIATLALAREGRLITNYLCAVDFD